MTFPLQSATQNASRLLHLRNGCKKIYLLTSVSAWVTFTVTCQTVGPGGPIWPLKALQGAVFQGGKVEIKETMEVLPSTSRRCRVAVGSCWGRERAERREASSRGSLPLWIGQKSHIHHQNALKIRNRAVCSSLHSACLAFLRSGFYSRHQNKYRTGPGGYMTRDCWSCTRRSPLSRSGFSPEWCWYCWSGGDIRMMCLWWRPLGNLQVS